MASFALLALAAGCADDVRLGIGSDDVTVDTSTLAARQQYDANVAFARAYTARCLTPIRAGRPRVLLTGFGRFMTLENNAAGRIVSALVPEATYPETHAPDDGHVDPPGPQLSVATATIDVSGIGAVDVCAMILPVYWDLAAILIAKELESFRPTFVLMNGVEDYRQPLFIELGATNRASRDPDGANARTFAATPAQDLVKIVESAPSSEDAQANLLSWDAVQTQAAAAVARHAQEVDGNVPFGDIVGGVALAGFPRAANTYLCNNVTYVTGWLMSHPGREVRLLRASQSVEGVANDVRLELNGDFASVPRVFVHWPGDLADKHHAAAADVMKSILAAQLAATRDGDTPTLGDNMLADPSLHSDDTLY